MRLRCCTCRLDFDWVMSHPFAPATCGAEECLATAQARAGISTPKRHMGVEDQNRMLCRKLGIESEYQGATLADFPGVRVDLQRGKSVRITGLNGRGKTRLACAILKHAAEHGHTGRFTTANLYLKRVRASYSRSARENEMDILNEHLQPDVLVLDDLGAEKQGDFGLGELLTLLSERGARGLSNIVTTNLKLVEVHKLEPRLASRLHAYTEIELTGDDRRGAPCRP